MLRLNQQGELEVTHLGKEENSWSHELGDGARLEPLELGAHVPTEGECARCLVLAGDRFFAFFPRRGDLPRDRPVLEGGQVRLRPPEDSEGLLVMGTLAGSKLRPRTEWSAPLRVPRGSRLDVALEDESATLIVHDGAAAKATVVHFDPNGARRAVTIDSVTLPVRLGGAVYFQPDPGTIACVSGSRPDRMTWSIAELTGRARQAEDTGAITLANEGLGSFAGNASEVVFVPWHGESILFLERAREIARLPAQGAKSRALWRAAARSLEPMLREVGAHLELVECTERRKSWELRASLSGGKELLLVYLLETVAERRLSDQLTRYGEETGGGAGLSGIGVIAPRGSLTAADVTSALVFLERHGVPLVETANFWIEWYNQLHDRGDDALGAPLDSEAEALLLWAALDALVSSGGAEGLATKLDRWRARAPLPGDVEQGLAALGSAPDGQQTLLDSLLALVAWIATHRFRTAAAPLWGKLVRELHRAGDLANSVWTLKDPLRFIASAERNAGRASVWNVINPLRLIGSADDAKKAIARELKPLLALEAAHSDITQLINALQTDQG